MAGLKPEWGRLTNSYQPWRPNQKPSGLACGTPYQTLPRSVPTMRNGMVVLVWCGVRLPGVTNHVIWLHHRPRAPLPIITGRGVKYTHNDRNSHILYSDSGPLGLCGISQASNQKEITVGDGGAQHRSIDPPTTWPSVADPPAASTIDQGGPPGLDPTTTPIEAYDVYSRVEANKFGKDFLRMAGIVQMLHALQPPYDKYPYAHPKRTRQPQSTRDQTRSSATV